MHVRLQRYWSHPARRQLRYVSPPLGVTQRVPFLRWHRVVLCRPLRADDRDFGRRERRRSPAPVTAPRATPTPPPASAGAAAPRPWYAPCPPFAWVRAIGKALPFFVPAFTDWACLRPAAPPTGATRPPNPVPAWLPKPVRAGPANRVPSGLVKRFFLIACTLRGSAQSASWTSWDTPCTKGSILEKPCTKGSILKNTPRTIRGLPHAATMRHPLAIVSLVTFLASRRLKSTAIFVADSSGITRSYHVKIPSTSASPRAPGTT